MANLNTMYPGVANSPDTYLREPLASGGSILYVVDGLVFGTLPTLAVIGDDHTAETILITAKRADDGYDITRAVEGNAKDWIKGTTVARNFTHKDYKTLVDNLELLNTEKVEKVEGKELSTNDFTDIRKDKVDNIPENPMYTDTVYTHPASHPATMITESSTKRFVSDTEKSTWNGKQDKLTAGTNVSISGNQISATDTKYTAGTNVTISGNSINATDTTYGLATASDNGLMSASDKAKLNSIPADNVKRNIILTQAAYDALSTAEQNRTDTVYFVSG